MNKYSVAYAGSIVSVIMALSAVFDVDLDEGSVTEITQASLIVIAGLVALYGRYRKGGLNIFGFRK